MKSFFKVTVAALFTLCACLTLFSCSGKVKDGNGFVFELDKESNTYVLTSYTGSNADVVIPDKYEGITVSTIGSEAFKDNDTVKTVKIPAVITEIKATAFYGCSSLTAVEFEDGSAIKEIQTGTFALCTMLNNVVLPDTVETIGYKAFSGCTGMTTFTLPKGLKTIEYYAFSECPTLKTVTINSSFTVYANAFAGCKELTTLATPEDGAIDAKYRYDHTSGLLTDEGGTTIVKFLRSDVSSYEIPANISSIKDGAFYEQFMLTEIKVKEGNTYYKEIDGVLYTADEKTLVAYPAGKVLDGENGVFTVPASTEKLANYAFCGTQNVSTVVLPESLKVIGNCAFKGCSKLVSVDSSASKDEVTVGINAFDGCKSLKSYRVNDNSSPMILKGSILFSDDGKKLISYAAELESGTYTLPAGVNEIEAGAFSLNKFISTFAVAAENTLFKSEGGVLYNADMTTLIAYPVAKTGDAFVCPATVAAVSAYAFCGNASLKTVTLPASVEALAPHVLEDCASLEALTLLGNELDIHMNALKGCAKLKTINFAGNEAAWKNASDNASSGNDVILTATLNYNYKAN